MAQPQNNAKAVSDKRKTFVYQLAKALAWVLFHTVYPVRIHDRERLNLQGPCILISNHLCWLDPVCVAHAVKGEEITYLAKKELLESRFGGALLRALHAIPVNRHNFDMAAMRACMQALKAGRALGIFPEGTRYKKGNMEELEAGVALLALRSSVPVIPVYIAGKLRPFHMTHVYAGKPMAIDDLREMGASRESSDELLRRITVLYAGLAEKAAEA